MNKPAPFTINQKEWFDRALASWFNTAEGGKRGGKNVLATLADCVKIETHPNKLHLVGGVSIATAKLNILDCDGFGMLNYFEGRCKEGKYKNRDCLYVQTITGEKVILVSGGGKDGDNKLIQGNTYGTAYITESNLCHPNFIKEVFDRTLSSADRWICHDLNPKAPMHWYYTDVLNFHESQQRLNPGYGYNYGHFTIADNMSIPDPKLKAILATYDKKSIWYKRDILGQRQAAEGIIYDMIDPAVHIVPTVERKYTEYMLSCDYGTQNPMVFGLWGYFAGAWYRIKEYYYCGRTEKKQKTDEQYHEDLIKFVGNIPVKFIVVDPSAASFIACLRRHGRFIPVSGNNDVVDGIRFTQSLITAGKLYVNDCCEYWIKESQGYIWDPESTEDEPLKEDDHCMDETRYFCYTHIKRNAYRYGIHLIGREKGSEDHRHY